MEVHKSFEQTLVHVLEDAVISFCQKYFCQSVALEVDGIVCVTEPANSVNHVVKLHRKLVNSKERIAHPIVSSKDVSENLHLRKQAFKCDSNVLDTHTCISSPVDNHETDYSCSQPFESNCETVGPHMPVLEKQKRFLIPECNVKTEPTWSNSTCIESSRDEDVGENIMDIVYNDSVKIQADAVNELEICEIEQRNTSSLLQATTELEKNVDKNLSACKNNLMRNINCANIQPASRYCNTNNKELTAPTAALLDSIHIGYNLFNEKSQNKQPSGVSNHKQTKLQGEFELEHNETFTDCDLNSIATGMIGDSVNTWQLHGHGIKRKFSHDLNYGSELDTEVKTEDLVDATKEGDTTSIQNSWTEFCRSQLDTRIPYPVGSYSSANTIHFDNHEGPQIQESQSQKRYACKYNCGMTFTRMWTRTRHETTRCPNAKSYTVYKCKFCQLQSRRRDDMHKHIRQHHQLVYLDEISEYILSFEKLVDE